MFHWGAGAGRLWASSTSGRESIGLIGPEEGLLRFAKLAWVDLSPQEGDLKRFVHGVLDFVHHCKLVAFFLWQDEGCVIDGAMALHLVSNMFVSNRTAALFLESLGSRTPRSKKVRHAMWTFRVK